MSAWSVGNQWAWEAGKQTNNGAITIKSTNGSTTYSGTQNPTGSAVKTNQSAVTQPPVVIITAASSSTISGAIQLNNGYVYVYDSGYATWIMLPNATFTANYNYTVDALSSNVWTQWVDTFFSSGFPYSYNIKCNPGAWASGTVLPGNFFPSGTKPLSGGYSIAVSGSAYASGSASTDASVPPNGRTWASYSGGMNATYSLWGVAINEGIQWASGSVNAGPYVCNSNPGLDLSGSGTISLVLNGGGGILIDSGTPATTWALMCLSYQYGNYYTCKVFNKDATTVYSMTNASALPIMSATAGKTYFSAGGQMFFISGTTLYSADYKNNTIVTLGTIGAAIPTAAYKNVAHK